MNEREFKYNGFTFIPFRQFTNAEGRNAINMVESDSELGLTVIGYPNHRKTYSHDGFYRKSTEKECDIFLCKDNGRLYVPGSNELFRWNGASGTPTY